MKKFDVDPTICTLVALHVVGVVALTFAAAMQLGMDLSLSNIAYMGLRSAQHGLLGVWVAIGAGFWCRRFLIALLCAALIMLLVKFSIYCISGRFSITSWLSPMWILFATVVPVAVPALALSVSTRAGRRLQLRKVKGEAPPSSERMTPRQLLGWIFHSGVFLATVNAIAPGVTASERHVAAVDAMTRIGFIVLLEVSKAYLIVCLTRACLGSDTTRYHVFRAVIAVVLLSLIPWLLVDRQALAGSIAGDLPGAIVILGVAWVYRVVFSALIVVASLLTFRFRGYKLEQVVTHRFHKGS